MHNASISHEEAQADLARMEDQMFIFIDTGCDNETAAFATIADGLKANLPGKAYTWLEAMAWDEGRLNGTRIVEADYGEPCRDVTDDAAEIAAAMIIGGADFGIELFPDDEGGFDDETRCPEWLKLTLAYERELAYQRGEASAPDWRQQEAARAQARAL